MDFNQQLAPSTPVVIEESPKEQASYFYNHAMQRMLVQQMHGIDVAQELMDKGLDYDSAHHIVNEVEEQIRGAKKKKAQKDMLWGAVWCVGGTVLTVASTGFIFWGAIIFGGFQFFRGLASINGD